MIEISNGERIARFINLRPVTVNDLLRVIGFPEVWIDQGSGLLPNEVRQNIAALVDWKKVEQTQKALGSVIERLAQGKPPRQDYVTRLDRIMEKVPERHFSTLFPGRGSSLLSYENRLNPEALSGSIVRLFYEFLGSLPEHTKRAQMIRPCPACGTWFHSADRRRKYCSDECSQTGADQVKSEYRKKNRTQLAEKERKRRKEKRQAKQRERIASVPSVLKRSE